MDLDERELGKSCAVRRSNVKGGIGFCLQIKVGPNIYMIHYKSLFYHILKYKFSYNVIKLLIFFRQKKKAFNVIKL
jgi:hypothetical protein